MSSPYTMWLPVCRWMLVSREPRRSPTLIPWTTPRTAPIRGMWCATQWQQAQILMIGIRSVKNCNPKCFFFFENVGKNNTFDGLSMLIGLFFPLKSSNFLDVYRLYARYFSIFRSIQVSICRVFRYQTEYLFRRACEYAMAQGVEVP